nr:MAG: capsid protein [Emberiza rustica CRESS-DNA-virus sp.]
MAFNRRRTIRRRRARRPVFGKRATKAIVAISQRPVETKKWPRSYAWGATILLSGYTAGSSMAMRSNIFRELPRADSTLTKTENEVIGNELMARGFWIKVNLQGAVVPGGNHYGVQIRLTVYSIADRLPDAAPLIEGVAASDPIFDQDFGQTQLTMRPFNMQNIRVLKSKRWDAQYQGNSDNFTSERKMWVPITGRKIASQEEPTVGTSSVFGYLKGRNYYWLLEAYSPGVTTLNSTFTGDIETQVYFKDA